MRDRRSPKRTRNDILIFFNRWLPFSDLREVMEFKIVHFFFRTTFALPTTFNFSLYMREATDNHILALVEVESSTWVILAAVCFLNLARIKIWQVGVYYGFFSPGLREPLVARERVDSRRQQLERLMWWVQHARSFAEQ